MSVDSLKICGCFSTLPPEDLAEQTDETLSPPSVSEPDSTTSRSEGIRAETVSPPLPATRDESLPDLVYASEDTKLEVLPFSSTSQADMQEELPDLSPESDDDDDNWQPYHPLLPLIPALDCEALSPSPAAALPLPFPFAALCQTGFPDQHSNPANPSEACTSAPKQGGGEEIRPEFIILASEMVAAMATGMSPPEVVTVNLEVPQPTNPEAARVNHGGPQASRSPPNEAANIYQQLSERTTAEGVYFQNYTLEGPTDPPQPGTTTLSQHGWTLGNHPLGSPEQQRKLDDALLAFPEAFSQSLNDLTGYRGKEGPFMVAPPGRPMPPPVKPINRGQRRQSPLEKQACNKNLQPLVEAGIIRKCPIGDYATNLVVVPKKDSSGSWTDSRVAVDYRPINSLTPTDHYKIPLPEEIHQDVHGSKWFSKMDLKQGFLQIPIPEELQHLTAFWWNGEIWCYTRCPYGLKNSPVHFQRVMNQAIMEAGLSHCAKCYVDDILCHSATFDDHLRDLKAILTMLIVNRLKAHPIKCLFGCALLEYLGHDISEYGLTPNEVKVLAIRALPDPDGLEQLRRVLGFANFYRGYVPFYSSMAQPLNELLGKGVVWDWHTNPVRAKAWNEIKDALCKPGNALKRADPTRQYRLHTDWSQLGLSAVLGQLGDDATEYMVACVSRSNNVHEKNYGSYKGEMLAAVWGIRTFRAYLHGAAHPFLLFTDHRSLQWLMDNRSLEGQYMRWACLIGDFDFIVHYKPGAQHLVADAPSRDPSPSTADVTGAREETPTPRLHPIMSVTEQSAEGSLRHEVRPPQTTEEEASPAGSLRLDVRPPQATPEAEQEVEQSASQFTSPPQHYALSLLASVLVQAPWVNVSAADADPYVAQVAAQAEPINESLVALVTWPDHPQRDPANAVAWELGQQKPDCSTTPPGIRQQDIATENNPVAPQVNPPAHSTSAGSRYPFANTVASQLHTHKTRYPEEVINHHLRERNEVEGASYMEQWDLSADMPLYGMATHLSPEDPPSLTAPQEALQRSAAALVSSQRSTLLQLLSSQPCPEPSIWARSNETNTIVSLDSKPITADQLKQGAAEGVCLLDLFGGLCGGLEMLLRNGVKIQRYLYSDKSGAAQRVARHRLEGFTLQYPHLLAPEAWIAAFTTVAQNVYDITPASLQEAATCQECQWVVVAGFECQDLSPAGKGLGLQGSRSNSFYPMLNIIGELQSILPHRPPIYIIENTAMIEGRHPTALVIEAYDEICLRLGSRPTLFDAARVESHAHRLRAYWTNIARQDTLQVMLDKIVRSSHISLSQILGAGRTPQRCVHVHRPPWYPVNVCGSLLTVLPTLVSTYRSHAFRDGGPGLVVAPNGDLVDLTIEERELAMGYAAGATAAPGVSASDRQIISGNCFDANAMETLWAVGTALAVELSSIHRQISITPATGFKPYRWGGGNISQARADTHMLSGDQHFLSACTRDKKSREADPDAAHSQLYNPALWALATAAEAQDAVFSDPFSDRLLMSCLQGKGEHLLTEEKERLRIISRAKRYVWRDNKLFRIMQDGTQREIPPPATRQQRVQQIHETHGHFGRRRTTQILLLSCWWPGLYKDVREVLQRCTACDMSKATFKSMQPTLQPLAIRGLMYRWSLDLFGPYRASARGHKYVMLSIEHFSKWIEAFPMVSKTAPEVAYHLQHGILARYGSPAEIVTDGGGEFEAETATLMQQHLIDHRSTSSNHPQANGLAERAIGTIKRCLARSIESQGHLTDWDLQLAWILMGYRVSPQASTKVSPYEMLFAVAPSIPSSIKERLEEPLDFEDISYAKDSILARAAALKVTANMAGHNLQIAQHRDTLRYMRIRSGGYLPGVVHFNIGDYVYTRRLGGGAGFEFEARPEILRVTSVTPKGVLRLAGRDGRQVAENAINCSPCHLPIKRDLEEERRLHSESLLAKSQKPGP